MKQPRMLAVVVPLAIAATGCSATHHAADVRTADQASRITVGIVQREVRLGMPASDVAAVLGSPNIVTTDDQRLETWIYDRISSDVTYSRSNGALVGLLFGSSGGGAATGSLESGSESSSQRTLTVILRFDVDNRVRDFSYHTSRF